MISSLHTLAHRRWLVALALAAAVVLLPIMSAAQAGGRQCTCDCRGDGMVTIDDLITAVRLALGIGAIGQCPPADRNGDGRVLVDELIAGVTAALNGCPATPTTTATATVTATSTAPDTPSASASATPTLTDTVAPSASATATVTATGVTTGTQSAPPSATVTATATASESVTPSATPTVTSMPAGTPTDTPRPNFLIIELDDTRFDGLDRMPTVDSRLTPESMRFGNGYVPLSSCCSSRASLLTGLYAFHHGTRQVSGPIGGAKTFRQSQYDHHTIAVWLHDAGYATGLFGKYLNEYNVESNRGPGGTYYIPPGWTRWRAFVKEHYGGIHGQTYQLVDEQGTVVTYDDHMTDLQYSTDVTGSLVRQFMAEYATAKRPFFAIWAPYASHGDTPDLVPIPADKYLDFFKGIPLFRPPNWGEEDRSDKARWAQVLSTDPILAAVTDDERELAYESLLSADDQISLMLDDLDALGIAKNTVVLLTSDNSVAWGEHAQFAQAKACPYEECIHVPFMVRYPARVQPGDAVTPALNIDIAPTVAELAGIDIPAASGFRNPDGESLVPALDGVPGWFRDDFLLEQWRNPRNAALAYSAQPVDGDRVRLFYGPAFPRASVVFEFDSGDGIGGGAIAVPIGADADTTYRSLGITAAGAVPHAISQRDTVHKELSIIDTDPAQVGFYWWEEVNQAGSFAAPNSLPDFFGVRDVLNGYTYVMYETGETELYNLNPGADPWQMQSVAADPAYAEVRQQLDARMRALAELP